MTDVLRHLIAMNCDFFANFAYSRRMKSEKYDHLNNKDIRREPKHL